MLVSVPLHLDTLQGKPTGADLQAVLEARYRGCDYVRVTAPQSDGKLEPEALNETNLLELSVNANERIARLCWLRGWTISARARPARRCRIFA